MDLESVDFQTGDVLLFHQERYWFSRVVEFFTDSKYSHVAMVLKDPEFTTPPLKGLYIFESGVESIPDAENGRIKFGVQIVPLEKIISEYPGNVYYRKLDCVRDEAFNEKMAKIHSNVHNISYDTDVADMIKAVMHVDVGDLQKQTTYWCSALLSYIFVELGFLPEDTPWTLITPKQFSSGYKNKLEMTGTCTLEDEVQLK